LKIKLTQLAEKYDLKLSNTAGFRNRLAHDYINLDDKVTILSGKKILNLYPKYLLAVKNYLKNL